MFLFCCLIESVPERDKCNWFESFVIFCYFFFRLSRHTALMAIHQRRYVILIYIQMTSKRKVRINSNRGIIYTQMNEHAEKEIKLYDWQPHLFTIFLYTYIVIGKNNKAIYRFSSVIRIIKYKISFCNYNVGNACCLLRRLLISTLGQIQYIYR